MNTLLGIIYSMGALCCSSLCVVGILIVIVLGCLLYAALLRSGMGEIRKYYQDTERIWGKRRFDNPDMEGLLRWFDLLSTFAPLQLRDEDKQLAIRLKEILQEEHGLSEEEANKVDDMQVHMSTADRLPPVQPGGEDEWVEIEEDIIPIVPLEE